MKSNSISVNADVISKVRLVSEWWRRALNLELLKLARVYALYRCPQGRGTHHSTCPDIDIGPGLSMELAGPRAPEGGSGDTANATCGTRSAVLDGRSSPSSLPPPSLSLLPSSPTPGDDSHFSSPASSSCPSSHSSRLLLLRLGGSPGKRWDHFVVTVVSLPHPATGGWSSATCALTPIPRSHPLRPPLSPNDKSHRC